MEFKKYFVVGTNDIALHDTMNGLVTGELIRCKDCKNKDEGQWYYYSGMEDGFCAWAEREEE